jgi:hypothetical protein
VRGVSVGSEGADLHDCWGCDAVRMGLCVRWPRAAFVFE